MRNVWEEVSKIAADHPLIATWLSLIFIIALLLGALHETRIGGEILIVLVRSGKHELKAVFDVFRRLWRELTTWKLDP